MAAHDGQVSREAIERIEGLADAVNAAMRSWLDASLAHAPERDHAMLGRLYDSIYAYLANGGRRMHAISLMLAFRAAGGAPVESILPVAVGFQLFHHYTLVHDDIYDEDFARRGSPTLHAAISAWARQSDLHASSQAKGRRVFFDGESRLGAIGALVQGKIVHALGFASVLSAPFPEDRLLAAIRLLNWHDLYDNAGQMTDVFHEGRDVPEPQQCLKIASLKTSHLFETGAECAAVLAGAGKDTTKALVAWASASAVAYQLKDDLEDLEDASEKGLGRGVGADIVAAKPTYVFAEALRTADPRQRRLLLGQGAGDAPVDVRGVIDCIRATGAIERCRERIDELIASGMAALERVYPPIDEECRRALADFSRYFVSDQYWRRPLLPASNPLSASK